MPASDFARQTRRRANLRHLIELLHEEGIQSWHLQGAILGMLGADLKALIEGAAITNEVAREIEWSMHRPTGWLDRKAEDKLDA